MQMHSLPLECVLHGWSGTQTTPRHPTSREARLQEVYGAQTSLGIAQITL